AREEEVQALPRAALSHQMMAIREYVKYKPPTFNGARDPLVAERWIDQTHKLMVALVVDEDLRVGVAALHLQDEADRWWQFIGNVHNTETMDWEIFKGLFFDKFFLTSV